MITDNSKVNENLLLENELLKEEISKLKFNIDALNKQLLIQRVSKSVCEHRHAFIIPNGAGAMQCSDCGEEI